MSSSNIIFLSGCRESNPDLTLPKRVYYHYTTPRFLFLRVLIPQCPTIVWFFVGTTSLSVLQSLGIFVGTSCLSVLQKYIHSLRSFIIFVDLRGVGPRPRPCHGRILPLNYRPLIYTSGPPALSANTLT